MGTEQQYINLFAQNESLILSSSPEEINVSRVRALADFRKNGFPTVKGEGYKYTDLHKAFSVECKVNFKRKDIGPSFRENFSEEIPRLNDFSYVILNDTFCETASSEAKLPEGVFAGSLNAFAAQHADIVSRYYGQAALTSKDALIALNTLFVQDGFVLYVPEDTIVETPIQLVNVLGDDTYTMANRRILVVLEPRSQAKLLVCDYGVNKTDKVTTQVVELFVGEEAVLDYYELEENTEATKRFSSLSLKQDAASNVLINNSTLSNGLTRNNYYVELNGEHAEAILCGLGVLDKERLLDTYCHITHAVPHCRSTELFKNVLSGWSVGSFCAHILVALNAQKAVAYQTNRNLLLSKEAKMYSKPQLEIYADDVKCSHGMTTGQLDETALFYLRSRGIPLKEAKMLLSMAFTADVLACLRLETLKISLQELVEKRFWKSFL